MSRRIMLRFFTLLMICIMHTSIILCIEVKVTSTAVSCNGNSDGIVSISVSGSSSEFTLRLMHASNNRLVSKNTFASDTTFSATNLDANEYKVQVISNEGMTEHLIKVEEPELLMANTIEIIKYATSQELCDGIVKINPSGGTPPYSYKWSENTSNSELQLVDNLCKGIYRCFVQDKYNCNEASATVYLINHDKKE